MKRPMLALSSQQEIHKDVSSSKVRMKKMEVKMKSGTLKVSVYH